MWNEVEKVDGARNQEILILDGARQSFYRGAGIKLGQRIDCESSPYRKRDAILDLPSKSTMAVLRRLAARPSSPKERSNTEKTFCRIGRETERAQSADSMGMQTRDLKLASWS